MYSIVLDFEESIDLSEGTVPAFRELEFFLAPGGYDQ